MKTMMKLTVMMVLLAFTAVVNAQSKMTEEQKKEAKARHEAYKQKLDLTEEQSAKVEEINTAYFEELSKLRDSDASRLTKYRKFKDLSNKKDKQMKEVLSKDQYKIYKEYQAEMKDEFMRNRRNG